MTLTLLYISNYPPLLTGRQTSQLQLEHAVVSFALFTFLFFIMIIIATFSHHLYCIMLILENKITIMQNKVRKDDNFDDE